MCILKIPKPLCEYEHNSKQASLVMKCCRYIFPAFNPILQFLFERNREIFVSYTPGSAGCILETLWRAIKHIAIKSCQ